MSTLADGLANYLAVYGAHTRLAGGGRVFPYKLPLHPTLPACTYRRIGGMGLDYTHQGESGIESGLFQISCWGNTYLDASRLATAVKRDLSGYHGIFSTPDAQIKIGACFIRGEIDVPEPDTETIQIALTVEINAQGGI